MSRKINLLPKKEVSERVTFLRTVLRRTAFFALSLFTGAVIIMIGINGFILYDSSRINAESDAMRAILASKQEDVNFYLAVSHKLDALEKIRDAQFPYDLLLTSIRLMQRPGVAIQTLTIEGRQSWKMGIVVQQPSDLKEFIHNLESMDLAKKFTFHVQSTTRQKDGGYLLYIGLLP